jgi:hypothetical protein
MSPAAYGTAQANAFYSAYNASPPTGFAGSTMFGSIDTGTGWTSVAANRALVGAFLSTITSNGGGYKTAGLYGNPSEYSAILNSSSWTPPVPVVVWEAEWPYTGAGPGCSAVEAAYSTYATVKVGSYITMIWQYKGAAPGPNNGDFDVTPYDGGPNNGKWNPTT